MQCQTSPKWTHFCFELNTKGDPNSLEAICKKTTVEVKCVNIGNLKKKTSMNPPPHLAGLEAIPLLYVPMF